MTVDASAFADHYNRIAAFAPDLAQRNPGVTGALAQASVATSGLPTGLVESTAGLQRAVSLARELQIQTPDIQAAVYNQLADADRNLLAQIGYRTPAFTPVTPTPEKHRGFFGSIGHALGTAGHDVLGALSAGQRAVQHVYRTTAYMDMQGHSPLSPSGYSSHNWADAWRNTTNGQKSYDQKRLGQIQGQYSPDIYNLAKQLSDGLTFDDVAPVGSPQRDSLTKVSQTPQFQSALDAIQQSHISFGRRVANGLGIDPSIGHTHLLSGVLDGTFDIISDPTLKLGTAVKATQAVRYGLSGASADDIDRMFQARSVRSGWSDITKQLNAIRETPGTPEASSALARINDAYPTATPMVQHMLDAGVHDVDSAQEFLRGNVGLGLLLKGQPFREMPLMPKSLSPVGEALVASKKAMRSVVDWRAFGPKSIPNPDNLLDTGWAGSLFQMRKGALPGTPVIGRRWALLARRATNRVPTAEMFNPLDPSAVDVIRRTALSFLPSYHANQIATSFLNADLGGKRTIYKGLLGQLMHASGAALNEPGRQYYGELMDDLEQWTRHTAYSAEKGVGVRPTASGDRELGFLGSHMTETWSLPSFKGMVQVAGRAGFMDRIGATVNRPGMDKMMKWWRWQVLTRPGFGLRAGADEVLGAVMRGGGIGMTKAFAAQRAITAGRATPWDPAVGLARVVAKALPDGAAAKVNNVGDLAHQWTLGGVGTVMRKGASLIAGPDMIKAARTISEDPLARHSLADILHQSRFNDVAYDGSTVGEASKQGFAVAPVQFGSDGSWDVRTANGWEGSVRWAHELEKLTHDPAGLRAAQVIASGTDDEARSVDLIRQVLASDTYKPIRKRAEIADLSRDGRRVSKGEVDQDVALRDWAQDIHDHAMSLLSANDGDQKVLIKPVLDHIANMGDSPGASFLAKMEHRPEGVVGKVYIPIAPPSGWDKFSNRAFELLATRPLNFLSRQPLTTYHYAQARKIYSGFEQQLRDAGHGEEAVQDLVHRHALQRAVEHTASYVHNPKMRTQLSVMTRNFLPFRHAEEGFYTRWARTMRDSPASVRKMQLTFEGLAHSGIVQDDKQTGQPVFVYPGTGFVYDAIARAHNLIPGLSAHPIPTNLGGAQAKFSSPLWYLNPGLTQLSQGHVYPQAGPLAALSMGVIRRMFPESELPRKLEAEVVGEQGAGKPLWSQFVPTVMQRLYSTWGVQSDTDGQLASATRSAIQYLDATGKTPPSGASPEDVDQYINRVKAMARTLLTMRVALGFVAPAAPSEPEFDKAPDPQYAAEGIRNMRDEFVALTQRMPYDEAFAEFERIHPDESPFKGGSFLAPQSKTAGSLFLPSTQKALEWMGANASFLKNYKLAGPMLIPDDPGKFNYDAYREQLALGVRSRQSVSDFYGEIKTQNAERQYYAVRDHRDQLIAEATSQNNKAAVQQINNIFDGWSKDFQAVNPLFAQFLASGGLRAEQRAETMDQVLKIAQDPNAPVDPSLRQPLQQLASAYAGQQADLRVLQGYTTNVADRLRKAVNAQFENTVAALIAANPRLVDLYNRVLRPMEA